MNTTEYMREKWNCTKNIPETEHQYKQMQQMMDILQTYEKEPQVATNQTQNA